MIREPIAVYAYTDLSGVVRGKGFPAALRPAGVGWTPTNLMFTALGGIAPSPWGPHGDVMLVPDPAAAVEVDFEDGGPAERFTLCDLAEPDGTPWACCPRRQLKEAAAALAAHGLALRASFEHEFVLAGTEAPPGGMYALGAVRRSAVFGETFLAALARAGVPADGWLAEFGAAQVEVTVPPADALAAADRAVIVKELARATAHRLGDRVTFSPKPTPEGIGSGVHIHFSMWTLDGEPVSHDGARPHGVSAAMGSFLAGVARHMPALCAFTAASPVSYLRMVPNAWVGVWSNVGVHDREAGVRICPVFGPPERAARAFNAEYRPADATANPYLALAAILRAGTAGLAAALPPPEPTVAQDPGTLAPAERAARGIVRLPQSLGEALDALEADETARGFLPPPLLAAYVANKRAEVAAVRDLGPAEICRRYAEVY